MGFADSKKNKSPVVSAKLSDMTVEEISALYADAKLYDFKTPKKFTKEQLRSLSAIGESFSRILSSSLSSQLRVITETNPGKIEEIKYGEFIENLPNKTLLGIISFEFEDGDMGESTLLMHIPPVISYFLIDILLGGPGHATQYNRAHTDIELAILKNILVKITDILAISWGSMGNIRFAFEQTETNPKMAQILAPTDMVVVTSFDVSLKQIEGTIQICLPALYLDHIFSINEIKMANKPQKIDAEKVQERRQLIYDSLSDSELELKAILCDLQLSTSQIMSLQVDDIIPLDKKIDDNITIRVDDNEWFTAKLGNVNIKKAVKLCDVIVEEENVVVN